MASVVAGRGGFRPAHPIEAMTELLHGPVSPSHPGEVRRRSVEPGGRLLSGVRPSLAISGKPRSVEGQSATCALLGEGPRPSMTHRMRESGCRCRKQP